MIDGYNTISSLAYMESLRVGNPNSTLYKTIYFASEGNYSYTLNGKTGKIDEHIFLY